MSFPMLPSSLSYTILLLLNRLAIGWYLAVAGWNKVVVEIDQGMGTFYRGGGYQDREPSWLPEFISMPYGHLLPWVELIFGATLLVGLFSRVSAAVVSLLFLSIGIALLGSGELFPQHHVMVFFTASALLFFTGPGKASIDHLFPGVCRT